MPGYHKIRFTVEQWEDVALEMDLTRIGKDADWKMLKKGAAKLGISHRVFRDYLLKWLLLYNRQTELMPIIKGEEDEESGHSEETDGIRELPDLTRG